MSAYKANIRNVEMYYKCDLMASWTRSYAAILSVKAQLGCELNAWVNMFNHQSILNQLMETPTTSLSLLNW